LSIEKLDFTPKPQNPFPDNLSVRSILFKSKPHHSFSANNASIATER